MPGGRTHRIAFTLLCAALALVLAYLGWGAAHPAKSAPIGNRDSALKREQVRPGIVRHFASVSKRPQVRKPRSPLAAVAARRPAAYRIAFFGDSVSVGFGASDRRHGYVALVSRWLRTHGKSVIETVHAKGGVPVAYWVDARIPKQLDAAVIELGTNDVRLGTSPAWFAQEYLALAGRIRATNPKVRLVCLSVWSHPSGARADSIINARIRAVCPRAYVEITGLRDRPDIRSSDGFHPNDLGYRLIAKAVESKLKTR